MPVDNLNHFIVINPINRRSVLSCRGSLLVCKQDSASFPGQFEASLRMRHVVARVNMLWHGQKLSVVSHSWWVRRVFNKAEATWLAPVTHLTSQVNPVEILRVKPSFWTGTTWEWHHFVLICLCGCHGYLCYVLLSIPGYSLGKTAWVRG